MSVEAISWAFRQKVKHAGAKCLLVALGNFADEDGYCFPSQKRLSDDTSQSPRSVREHLVALEDAGLIVREKRRRQDGTKTSDGFRLCMDVNITATEPAAKSAAGTEREHSQRQISPAANLASGEICQTPAAKSAGQGTVTSFDEPSDSHEGDARAHSPPVLTVITETQPPTPAKPRKGTRLEADWRPTARDLAYAVERGWDDGQIRDMADDFREHFTNGRGRNETSPDWSLRWQRWVRQQEHYGRRPGARAAGGPSTRPGKGGGSAHRNLADSARRAAAIAGGRG